MNSLVRLFVVALLALTARATEFEDAIAQKRLRADFTGNGRDTVTAHLVNLTADKLPLTLAAGLVLTAENGEKQILLRTFTTELAASAEADASLPAVAMSSKNSGTARALQLTSAVEPKLAKLLPLFASQNDLPRPTAQLAVFLVLEEMTWPQWQQWMHGAWSQAKPQGPHPNATDIAQMVDALAFAKLAAPDRKFALLADAELKLLALRTPSVRGKAMALYGLSVDDALTGEPAVPPDLSKLLHTSQNDNCPICRQRAKMSPDNGL
jgi:hypothetical protein